MTRDKRLEGAWQKLEAEALHFALGCLAERCRARLRLFRKQPSLRRITALKTASTMERLQNRHKDNTKNTAAERDINALHNLITKTTTGKAWSKESLRAAWVAKQKLCLRNFLKRVNITNVPALQLRNKEIRRAKNYWYYGTFPLKWRESLDIEKQVDERM